MAYQLMKSIDHSTMAVGEVVMPYLDNSGNRSWLAPLLAYRSRMDSALKAVMRPTCRRIGVTARNNIAFMNKCAANGVITMADLQRLAKIQGLLLKKVIAWAAQTQVAYWMDGIGEWKKALDADWDKTYAASNTIYVTRQNNVLFSVLAQYFGPAAINDRLFLIETISFTTTPQDMLEVMTRIIADRSVGAIFSATTG